MSKLDHAASLISSDAASPRKATLAPRARGRKSINAGYDPLYLRREVTRNPKRDFYPERPSGAEGPLVRSRSGFLARGIRRSHVPTCYRSDVPTCLQPSFVFKGFHTLSFSVRRKSFACHSYENCRVCTNSSHSGTRRRPDRCEEAGIREGHDVSCPYGGRENLLGSRIRVVVRRLGFTAEGQLERARNLRPEFAEHVETCVLKDAVAHPLRCVGKAAFVVGLIRVAKHDGAGGPQPFRNIEHACAIVAVSYDRVLQGMEQALPGAAMGEAVVARVLRKYPGIRKVFKESGRGLTGEFGAKAPAISFRPLSIAGVRVCGLVQPGVETAGEKRHGIKRILDEQNEFIFQLESAQFRAGLVVRGVHRLAFQGPGKGAHDLLQRSVVVFQPHHRRRLNARRGRIFRGFFLQRRIGRLLWRSRRRLRANYAASQSGQHPQEGRFCQRAKASSVAHGEPYHFYIHEQDKQFVPRMSNFAWNANDRRR